MLVERNNNLKSLISRIAITILVCYLLLPLNASLAAPLTLVQDGEPRATIVVQAKAPLALEMAATDLQRYIKKITGVELPLKTDGKMVNGSGLYLGNCEPTRQEDLPAKELNPETYAIHRRGNNVFFMARYPTPVTFAVYSFLEESLGVRWFAPGDDWEYVPSPTPGELKLEINNIVRVPETSPRIWSGHHWNQDWKDWNRRNKTLEGEVVQRRQFQNMLTRIFPVEKYADTHPEYFPLIQGKRWIPTPGAIWRPCESNVEVQRITVDYIRQYFKDNPTVDSFSLGMDDVRHFCSCTGCRAMDAQPDDYEKRRFSDRHYKFVQIIASEIKKSNPDKFIGTLVYSVAREIPKTIGKLEDNVFGYLAEQSALWYYPERKQAEQELTRQWSQRLSHLSRYDYYGMGSITPRVYPHFMAEQIKLDKSLGLEGMYSELYTFLPHTAPMIWALAKLQWDSKQDIDSLLNEFYQKMYGPSAGTMSSYYKLLEDTWGELRPGRGGHVFMNLHQQAAASTPQAVRQGMALLETAVKQADSEVIKKRIEVTRAGLEYASYVILPYGLSQELSHSPVVSQSSAQETLTKMAEILRLQEQRNVAWSAAMARTDLLGETLRGLASLPAGRQNGLLAIGQLDTLGIEKGFAAGALKVLDFYAEARGDEVQKVVAQLKDLRIKGGFAEDGEFARAILAWEWVNNNKPATLLVNGYMETAAKGVNIPTDWTRFSSDAKAVFSLIPNASRRGQTALTIKGNNGNASLLQKVEVKPGQKYLCVMWSRIDSPHNSMHSVLNISFETAGSGALSSSVKVSREATREWQPIQAIFTIPEKATHMVVKPTASRTGEATFFIDEIALYRLPDNF
jgi:hypothetical protein